ncbi:MAG: hypothetical protein U0529_04170 [Thermoanaerobaculia bacterium]
MRTLLPFRPAGLRTALVAVLLALPLGGAEPAPPADGRVAFEATWSAAGQRRALRAGEREVVTTHLSGAFIVLRGEGLRRGFRGEALFFSNGRDVHAGTLVLTDDRGDQVFADLEGEASARGAEIRGAIRGGTGAWAGISGDFSFRWRQLVRTPEGEIQGLAEGLKGAFVLPARPETPR